MSIFPTSAKELYHKAAGIVGRVSASASQEVSNKHFSEAQAAASKKNTPSRLPSVSPALRQKAVSNLNRSAFAVLAVVRFAKAFKALGNSDYGFGKKIASFGKNASFGAVDVSAAVVNPKSKYLTAYAGLQLARHTFDKPFWKNRSGYQFSTFIGGNK